MLCRTPMMVILRGEDRNRKQIVEMGIFFGVAQHVCTVSTRLYYESVSTEALSIIMRYVYKKTT